MLDGIPHYCPISSHYQWNLDGLMDKVKAPPRLLPPRLHRRIPCSCRERCSRPRNAGTLLVGHMPSHRVLFPAT